MGNSGRFNCLVVVSRYLDSSNYCFCNDFKSFVGVLSGVFIPLLLRSINLDPGVGGTVIVTTITDIAGFVSFLGLATIFLI